MHFSLVIAVCVAVICAYAGAAKLRDPGGFVRAVRGYHILNARLVTPVALAIVVGELGVGLLMALAVVPSAISSVRCVRACFFA
jgi:uncharacterized membrane protein YphA (DoxX/SURF4 family)